MSVISIAGQRWVAKTTEYKIPGGVTTTPYPLEPVEETYVTAPTIALGNLSRTLVYYTLDPEVAGVYTGNMVSGSLSSIVKYGPSPTLDEVTAYTPSMSTGLLSSIVQQSSMGPDYMTCTPGVLTTGWLDTIVIFYSRGLPEEVQVSLFAFIGGNLSE